MTHGEAVCLSFHKFHRHPVIGRNVLVGTKQKKKGLIKMISAVLTGKNVTWILVLGALAAFGSLTAPAATVLSTARTAESGGVSYHTSSKFLGGSSEM